MTWAIILIILGLALLIGEVFIPSGGLFFIFSMAAVISGVTLVFFAPESEGGGKQMGLLFLAGVFILIPAVVGVAFHYWPRTPMGKRLFLAGPDESETLAAMPDYVEREGMRGQIGKTLTPHCPSGVTLIQGRRIDTKTEGLYVDAGQWVRVVDVHFGQVTIRPITGDEIDQMPDLTA